MAFTAPDARAPVSVGRITVILTDRAASGSPSAGGEEASQTAMYQLAVLDQNGQHIHFGADRGDLVPHITAAQRSALMAFMADLRAQVEQQILGG